MTLNKRMYLLFAALILLAFAPVSCSWNQKSPMGLVNNKLAPCPGSPNCVSSEDAASASRIEPLVFKGEPALAWLELTRAIQSIGGTIRQDDKTYLWATFTSRIFRFVDDLECRMDADNKLIHVRSASRIGHYDFGVNRKRVEKLRQKFAQRQAGQFNPDAN